MESETEFRWIVNLLNSSYIKGYFKSESGCKRDFERTSGSGENNKYFRKWFDSLLECGVIEFHSNLKSRCKAVPTYVIVYKKLIKILRKNEFYDPTKRIMYKEYESII